MEFDPEVLESEATGPSGHLGSDRSVGEVVSFCFIITTNISLAHPHRRADWISKTSSPRNLHSDGMEWFGSSSGLSPPPALSQAPVTRPPRSVFVSHYNDEYLTRAPSQEGRLDL